jgi:ABC-2 type transport system ATP-binding protein
LPFGIVTTRFRYIGPIRHQHRDAAVDFLVFDARTRSLKKRVLGMVGGTIERSEGKVPIIEALGGITVDLEHGDRVALVGHNGAGRSMVRAGRRKRFA